MSKKKTPEELEEQAALPETPEEAPENPNRAKKINKRSFRHGALAAAFTAVFIAAVIVLNIIVGLLSERFDLTADLTKDSMYTLDKITEEFLLNRLDSDVSVTVLNSRQNFEGDKNYRQISEILRKMELSGGHVKVDFVSIDQNPNFISQFKDETVDTNYIVVKSEKTGRHRIVSPADYFGLSSDEAMYYYYYYGYVSQYSTEQEIVSAMMYVTNEAPVRIAFTEGFGETDSSGLVNLLSDNGYDVETVNLLTTPEIDSGIDFVIVHAPRIDLDNEQLAKLDRFLDNNGEYGKSVFYFASVSQPRTPNIDSFLSDWGLSVGYSVIGQSDYSYLFSSLTAYAHLQQISYTDFTAGTYGSSLYTLGADLRPVFVSDSADSDCDVLMKTFDGAFLYPLDYDGGSFDADTAESGVFNDVAAAAKYSANGTPSRVFAIGSDQLSSSYLMSYNNANNSDFFVNLFNFLSGKEAGITIKPKAISEVYFEMDAAAARTLGIILCVVIPVCVIVLGIVIWLRRRHR